MLRNAAIKAIPIPPSIAGSLPPDASDMAMEAGVGKGRDDAYSATVTPVIKGVRHAALRT